MLFSPQPGGIIIQVDHQWRKNHTYSMFPEVHPLCGPKRRSRPAATHFPGERDYERLMLVAGNESKDGEPISDRDQSLEIRALCADYLGRRACR